MSTEKAELVRVFFPAGCGIGMREAEFALSTVKAFAFGKELLPKVGDVSGKPGVYILIGENRMAYIGQSEDIGKRLTQHADPKTGKSFWLETIVLISKDDWLSAGHVRNIEAELIKRAKNGLWKIENVPNGSDKSGALPSADKAIIKRFIEQSITLVEILGCDIFKPKIPDVSGKTPNRFMSGQKYSANAIFDDEAGILVVLKGSKARFDEANAIPQSASSKRKELLASKVLIEMEENGNHYLEFLFDVEFKSLSAAAAVIAGGSVSGPAMWVVSSEEAVKQSNLNLTSA